MATSNGIRLVKCTACGADNRVAYRHLAQRGKCGKCGQGLDPTQVPIDVGSEADFDALLAQARVPLLVDFWAPWCGPCRMAAPILADMAREFAGRCVVLKVNTDELPALGARYSVRGIPHFAVLRAGAVAAQQSGVLQPAAMRQWLARALG